MSLIQTFRFYRFVFRNFDEQSSLQSKFLRTEFLAICHTQLLVVGHLLQLLNFNFPSHHILLKWQWFTPTLTALLGAATQFIITIVATEVAFVIGDRLLVDIDDHGRLLHFCGFGSSLLFSDLALIVVVNDWYE